MTDRGRDLDDRLHQLGVDTRFELVPADRAQHRIDVLDEIERLSVEQLVLLLDTEGVRVAFAERVLEHAARVRSSLAGDRGRDGLLLDHGTTASTSISSFQAGSMSEVTTVVLTGRTSRNTSPCARATSSKWAGSVRKIRVLTTCSRLASARRSG